MPHFPSTQWSLIRQAGASPSGRQAFTELVRAYRAPILAFFRARLPADAAEDATQSFLAASFEHDGWTRADASLSSFRNFLRVLLRRHLGKLRAAQHPLADATLDIEPIIDEAPAVDQRFDLRFALALTACASACASRCVIGCWTCAPTKPASRWNGRRCSGFSKGSERPTPRHTTG